MATAQFFSSLFRWTGLGVVTAALWGASDFLGGVATRKAPALLVVTLAHSMSAALLVLLAFSAHAPLPDRHAATWGIITGLLGGLALIAFYQALALGEMGLTAALSGLLTALVPVIFSFFTEGLPGTTQIIGFAVAALAIWLIAHVPGRAAHPRGLGLATLAGLGFGGFLIASKIAAEGGILWPLAYSRVTSACLAGTMLLGVRLRDDSRTRDGRMRGGFGSGSFGPEKLGPETMRLVLMLAAAAGVLEAVGNLLFMESSRTGRLDVASVLASLYPAGTILLATWLLRERATRTQALGIALALGAVVLVSFGER